MEGNATPIYAGTMESPFGVHGSLRLSAKVYSYLQCVWGLLLTAMLAVAGTALSFNLSTMSLLYLLLVVAYAVRFGFWQASVVSIAALAFQDYYFTAPAYSFYISDRRNAVAILVFEVTALLVSRVSASEKKHATDAERKRQSMERLYSISRGALLFDMTEPPERGLAELINTEFSMKAVAISNLTTGSVGATGCSSSEAAEWMRRLGEGQPDESGEASHRILQNANRKLGSLLVVGEMPPLAMDSLASLLALTLDRHQAFVNQGIAEAARRTEQLRTTVLDGLAHAFKTPLTIIRAASSGLIEIDRLDELERQLTQVIDEQSIRLDELATKLLRTARVAPENICLEAEMVSVPELIQDVIAEFRAESKELDSGPPEIDVTVTLGTPHLSADHELLSTTLKELMVNAAKYSYAGSPIAVTASDDRSQVLISINSRGAPIPKEDQERIFDIFYRSASISSSTRGTGIGLSVARRVTEAHGGEIWVVSDEVDGTTFHISLPKFVKNNIPVA